MINKNKMTVLCLFGAAMLTFAGCGKNDSAEQAQEVAAIDSERQTGIDEKEAEKFVDDTSEDVQSFFDGTDEAMNLSKESTQKLYVEEEPVENEDRNSEGQDNNDDTEDAIDVEETGDEEEEGSSEFEETEDADTSDESQTENQETVSQEPVTLDVSSELTGLHHVEMTLKDYGTIEIELDADVAPITVTNFVKLVQEGFYDGLTFHRIIPGFIVQGGDPDKNGTGGSKDTIKGEFASNGVENSISHEKGVISMARTSLPDSASSQFFIMLDDKSDVLDGEYAAFGKVTSGMEFVEAMANDAETIDNNGTVPEDKQPVLEKAVVLD
ncbi:MAG: peptidylprolyl isomerase [Eubacteriales bacterium]|nr:peptidylprolyl isomerase [Eubacteriales bacterium]